MAVNLFVKELHYINKYLWVCVVTLQLFSMAIYERTAYKFQVNQAQLTNAKLNRPAKFNFVCQSVIQLV